MSWVQPDKTGKKHTLNYAVYSNGNWGNTYAIATESSWFVNWADFPSVIASVHGPMAAHWLDKISGGSYAYNVNISMMNVSGQWSAPIVPHSDSTATEHGFASMIPWDETTILAVWLDGRQAANDSAGDYYNLENAMTLRGALISTSGIIIKSFLIDNAVCDCCQTSLIKTEKGAMVAYRNRTENEIRDIYVSRFNGREWSKPVAVHDDKWKIGACPVNGPKLAATDSLIAIAWHTAAGKKPTVKASVSVDGGETFRKPYTVSEGKSLGRVDAAIYHGNVFISWMEKENDTAYLKLKRLNGPQTTSKTINVSKINDSRKTGFPQLEVFGNQLIMAWTVVDSSSTPIKTVIIDLPF